jgi:hypothetical protein
MSSVEYKCPECGHRLFAEPNTKFKYPCPNVGKEYGDGTLHQEAIMAQVGEFVGPNFLYRDVGDTDTHKTGIITPGTGVDDTGHRTITPVIIPSKPVELTPEEELEELRAFWFRLTGEPADRRLKNATLRRDIEELERSRTPEPTPLASDEEALEAIQELKNQLKAQILAELKAELTGSTANTDSVTDTESEPSDADS